MCEDEPYDAYCRDEADRVRFLERCAHAARRERVVIGTRQDAIEVALASGGMGRASAS